MQNQLAGYSMSQSDSNYEFECHDISDEALEGISGGAGSSLKPKPAISKNNQAGPPSSVVGGGSGAGIAQKSAGTGRGAGGSVNPSGNKAVRKKMILTIKSVKP
jgi:hypothetical protein